MSIHGGMTFLSYAQNYEDVLLWRALQSVESGRYVDIGAQDPVTDSVSKAFHLRGWKGVHVDPSPTYADALRKDRPDDVVIQAAVGLMAGPIPFFLIPNTGLSTGVASIAEEHRRAGYEIQEFSVPVVPLNEILEPLSGGPVHWMKIDVEGMESDVLDSWGTCGVRPWILVIEATYPNSEQRVDSRWIDKVCGRDYHDVYFDGLSRYFVSDAHPELDAAFGSPPNVFDRFAVASHHFSASEICHQNHQTVSGLQAALNEAIAGREAALSEAQLHARERERLSDEFNKVTHSVAALTARLEECGRQFMELAQSEATARKALMDVTALEAERVLGHEKRVADLRCALEQASAALRELTLPFG